jgi:hypothetical protein
VLQRATLYCRNQSVVIQRRQNRREECSITRNRLVNARSVESSEAGRGLDVGQGMHGPLHLPAEAILLRLQFLHAANNVTPLFAIAHYSTSVQFATHALRLKASTTRRRSFFPVFSLGSSTSSMSDFQILVSSPNEPCLRHADSLYTRSPGDETRNPIWTRTSYSTD